jgi:uncharacterized delta-60 repeat protein
MTETASSSRALDESSRLMAAATLLRRMTLGAIALIAAPSLVFAQAGRLDSTFGQGGKVVTAVPGPTSAVANAMALQSDGKIVVAGGLGAGQAIGLVRYSTSGALDTAFGAKGIAQANIPNNILSSATGVAIQTDGKILAGGTVYTLSGAKAAISLGVVRFNANGTMDSSYGAGGVVTALPLQASRCGGGPMAIQSDGKVLLAGGCSAATGNFSTVVRLNTNGALDTTFGTAGAAVLAENPSAIALQADGRIVVAGGGIVSRYNANGSVDSTFGIFGSAGAIGTTTAVAIQGDGKIVVAGTFSDQLTVVPDGDFALVRYNSDGSIDQVFGTRGGALADFFTGASSAAASALAIQTNGEIVVAGRAALGSSPSQFAVARFTSAGALDTSFGTGGVVTTSFGETDAVAAIAVQTDGKVVAAGNSFNAATSNDSFALARYTVQ